MGNQRHQKKQRQAVARPAGGRKIKRGALSTKRGAKKKKTKAGGRLAGTMDRFVPTRIKGGETVYAIR